MQTPRKPHLDVVSRILRYIKTYFAVWNFSWSQYPITSTWIHGC
jgi:hypothetical protein